jgi:hypothetical protein
VVEAGPERAGVERAALVLGQALRAAEPVGVQQRGGVAGAADRQAAREVELDEPVADLQDAEILELCRGVERGRGLDVVGGGQG